MRYLDWSANRDFDVCALKSSYRDTSVVLFEMFTNTSGVVLNDAELLSSLESYADSYCVAVRVIISLFGDFVKGDSCIKFLIFR